MEQSISPGPDTPDENSAGTDTASMTENTIKKIAARAVAASTKLENREVPAGHVRSEGVKAILAEREARKR